MTDMVTTNNDPDDSTSSCPNHKIEEAQEECGIPIIVRWDPSPERKDEEGIALETLIPSSRQSVAGLTRYVVENVIFHLFLQRMIHSLKHKKKSSHDNITYHLHYGDGYTTHLKIKTTTNTTTTTNKSPVSLHDYHVDVCIRLYFPYTQHELHPMDTLHDLLALYPPSNNNKYEFSLITQWNAIPTDISSLTTKKVLQQRSNNGNKEKKQRTLFVEMNLQKTSFQISLLQQQQNHNENGTKRKLQTQNDIPNDLEQPSQKRILNNNTTNEKKDNDASMSSSSSSLVSYNSSLDGGNGDGNGNVDGDDEKEKEKEDEQFNSTNGVALTKNNDEAATTKLLTGASSKTIEADMKLDESKTETNVEVSESTTAKINEKISPSKDDTMTKQKIDEGSNDAVNANDDEDSSSVSSDSSESLLEGNQDNQQSSSNISGEIDDTTTKPTNNDNPSKTVSITQLNDDKDELKNGDKDDDNASMSSSSSSSVSSDSSSEVSSSSSSDDDNDDDDGGGDEEDEEKHTNENNNDNLKVDPPNNTIPPGEVTPSEEHVEEEDDDDEKKKNDKNMNDIDSSSKSSSSLPTSMSSVVSESSSPGKKDKDETKTNVPNEVAMDDHEDVSHMDTPIRELFKMDNTTAKTNNDTNKITTNNKNDEAENEKADKGQDDNGSSSSSSVSSSSLSSSSSDSESSIDEPEKSEELPVSQKHLRLSQSSQNSKKRRPQPLFDPKKIVIQAEKGGIRP